jgi:hypothetical protein
VGRRPHRDPLQRPGTAVTVFDKNPQVTQGAIVENMRLDAVLALIQAGQVQRDRERLASKKLTLRQKERIKCARAKAGAPALGS